MKITPQRRALDKIYKRRDRYEIPEWQRGEVWDIPKKQQLVDSILRGWRLPKFYFVKNAEDEYEVVDGQQRLTAIYDFLPTNSRLRLTRPSSLEVHTIRTSRPSTLMDLTTLRLITTKWRTQPR